MTYHKDDLPDVVESEDSDGIPPWDTNFLKQLDPENFFGLLMAAKDLEIKGLLAYACKTVANKMKSGIIREMCNFKTTESE